MPAARALPAPAIIPGHGVVAPPAIGVASEAFSGDIAELFRLARVHGVDLLRVPLADLARAYLTYRAEAPDASIEEAAAALAILAYLAERKAWLMVPRPEVEPEEPEEETIAAIAPLPPGFLVAISRLEASRAERERRFFRETEPGASEYEIPVAIGEIGPSDLARAFERLLRRTPPAAPQSLARTRPDLGEIMRGIMRRLTPDGVPLERLFPADATRSDLVFGFLALLELIRLGRARAFAAEGEIAIAS